MKRYVPLFEDFDNDDGGIAFPDEETINQQFEKYGLQTDDIVYDEVGGEISVSFISKISGGVMPKDISDIMESVTQAIGAKTFTFWEPNKKVSFAFRSENANEANYREEEAFANSGTNAGSDTFNKDYPEEFAEDEMNTNPMTYEDVMAILDDFEPDFEYAEKEIGFDEKNTGRATEYDVWVDFSGVKKEVVEEFEREPDVKDQQFKDWCKSQGLYYHSVMTGAQGESVLFQVISF